jgi:hypothetical protein
MIPKPEKETDSYDEVTTMDWIMFMIRTLLQSN